MRTTSSGVITVENYDPKLTPFDDVTPPSRIDNLDVVRVFGTNKSAILSWTQPGDDLNAGEGK